MKPRNTISLRRRHLVIAGLMGAATPGAIFAAQCTGVNVPSGAPAAPEVAELLTSRTEEKLVVSGRIVGGDCKPLAGAVVVVWHADPKEAVSATTDADGRFMLTTKTPVDGPPDSFHIRVSHPERGTVLTQRYFPPSHSVSEDQVARFARDDAGTWRTTLGLTLA